MKQNQMSPEEMEKFSNRMEEFAGTLSDNERTLLQHMIVRGFGRRPDESVDPSQFRRVSFRPITFESVAPKLDANFFKVMCW